jgi:PAS domain S-box-containing protein
MIQLERNQMGPRGNPPLVADSTADCGTGMGETIGVNLSSEERAELLDVNAWAPMLEMYGLTMKVAVSLTDPKGQLLGSCHNAQPVWTLVQKTKVGNEAGCPFCLSPSLPCRAVADALRTGRPTIVRDLAGLMHVAVPLSLGKNDLGAIIAGQVPDQYPESLIVQRVARKFGISAQLLWDLSSKQRPVSRATLQLAADLLSILGKAFLRERYGAILETKISQANLRFRLLVEGVTDYALFTTDHLGLITGWNIGAERMLGYHEPEILGQHFSRMFPSEDIQDHAAEKQLGKAALEGRAEDEGWRIRENKTQFWANVIITPLAAHGDFHRGFAIVMQDITVRRKAQIELETVRQERTNLQEQFLSHVSHELRTPLTAIYFFITNLLDGVAGSLTSGQRETLEFSLENVKQLKDMVSDLLDVSRIETLKLNINPQCMSVRSLVAEVLRTCHANAELKNVSLNLDIAEPLPSAWADRARIRQVLINLIDNGIRFTPGKGTITIHGEVFEEDSRFLCLSVTDTGCGISPGNYPMVFDRLAQVETIADTSRKGLGLGLFISKELISQQGGRIWVSSQVGKGSTFYFTLPVFSLARFCASIFTPTNLAARCVTLLSIDVSIIEGATPMQDLAGIRKVLERSIFQGQDVLLPPMTDTETKETFFIIACADESGAEAMTKRLRRDLETCKVQPRISLTTVQLSANDQPLEIQISDVTTQIDKLIQTRLAQRRISDECKENLDCR